MSAGQSRIVASQQSPVNRRNQKPKKNIGPTATVQQGETTTRTSRQTTSVRPTSWKMFQFIRWTGSSLPERITVRLEVIRAGKAKDKSNNHLITTEWPREILLRNFTGQAIELRWAPAKQMTAKPNDAKAKPEQKNCIRLETPTQIPLLDRRGVPPTAPSRSFGVARWRDGVVDIKLRK